MIELINKIKTLFTKRTDQAIVRMTDREYKDYITNQVISLESIFEKSGFIKQQALSNPAQNSYIMYKCVQTLSDRIPMIPLKFYNKRTSEEVYDDNEIIRFVNNPGNTTLFEMLSMSVAFYSVYGEIFWTFDKTVGNQMGISKIPAGIQVINPANMQERLDGMYNLTGWTYSGMYNNDKISYDLSVEDVIQIKNSNIYNQYRGIRAIDALANELGVDYNSIKYLLNFYLNSAIPGTILIADKDAKITAEDMKAMATQFDNRHQGTDKAYKTAGLGGGVDVKTLSITQDKAQFIETKNFIRDTVLAVMNVPLTYAGYTEGINRATADAQERVFWQGAQALLTRIQTTINSRIIDMVDPSIYCEFDFTSIPALQENRAELITSARQLFEMGWTRNELAEYMNMNLPNDDPSGDIRYVPFGLTRVDQEETSETDLPEEMEAEEQTAEEEQENTQIDNKIDDSITNSSKNKVYLSKYLKLQAAHEARFNSKIKSYMFNQRGKVLKTLDKIDNAIDKVDGVILTGELASLFEKEHKRLQMAVEPLYIDAVTAGQQLAIENIGVDVAFNLKMDIVNNRVNKIVGINQSTFKRIQAQINEALNNGESTVQIAERIKKIYNFTNSRAVTIARTETSSIISESTMQQYKDAGVQQQIWLTAGDSNVREEHVANGNAGPVNVGSEFPSGERFPGEKSINCRCALSPYIGN
jgi:HK97 family phage portal protein